MTPIIRLLTGSLCATLWGVLFSAGAFAEENKSTAGTIAASAEEVKALPAGARLPDADVTTLDGKPVQLSQLVAGKPTALIFYRGGWCPYCNKHLKSLKDAEEPLKELGFQLIAIAPDLPAELAKTIEKQEATYTFISDAKVNAAKALGIAFKVDGNTIERYKGFGIDLDASSGESHHALPVPAIFLTDSQGIIRFVHADPDYKKRLDNEKLLAAAKEVAGK